jgi:RNA polymerase sigma-70 factor (ECF subfamily)
MLRVVRYIKRFSDEKVFWSWLTVLARTAAIDEKRKQKRYFGLLARFFQRNHEPWPATHAIEDPETELLALLQENLGNLSHDERDLLDRKYMQGESVAQIAATLELTPKAVESRLTRVREKLRQNILEDLKDYARR